MKHFILLTFCLFSLWSCKQLTNLKDSSATINGSKQNAKVLYINENDAIGSLYPLHASDAISARISSQIYEGLFKLNPTTLNVEHCLVNSHTVDSTGTLYHFTLKDSVFFHDDPCFDNGKGKMLTSDDVIYTFNKLCTYTPHNHAFYAFHDLVEGADDYYNLTKSGKHKGNNVSGISKIDDLNFTIKLLHPSTVFKFILCEHQTFIYPKEYILHSLDKNTSREVGTGPFKLNKRDKDGILLVKNPNYHLLDSLGNKYPLLDELNISFIEDKHIELDSFINLSTDVIYKLPADLLLDLHLHQDSSNFSYEVIEKPEMSLDYIGFNVQSKTYSNKNLRKAIAFALDKKKILERSLEGEADEIGNHGITPPLFKQIMAYNTDTIHSITHHKDSAAFYIKQAKVFTDGEPRNLTLYYNIEGHRNDKVVNTISRELKRHLNIDLLVKPMHQMEYNEAVESGEAGFFLSSWVYEYPHPMDHLSYFYSDGIDFTDQALVYPDIFRYHSYEFNKYYKKAFYANTTEACLKNLLRAEQILINDIPVIPLWYNEGYLAKQEYVKDFVNNAVQYRDFRQTTVTPYDVLLPQ